MTFGVEDTGVGIGEDDLRHVGDPFFQARTAYDRPHDGTGLGLVDREGAGRASRRRARNHEPRRVGHQRFGPPADRLRKERASSKRRRMLQRLPVPEPWRCYGLRGSEKVPERAITVDPREFENEGGVRGLLRRALGRNPLDAIGIFVLCDRRGRDPDQRALSPAGSASGADLLDQAAPGCERARRRRGARDPATRVPKAAWP